MKKVVLIALFMVCGSAFASEVRMATSEDIDLFDKAIEASSEIEKRNFKAKQVKLKNNKSDLKNLAEDGKTHKPGAVREDSEVRGQPFDEGSSVKGRFKQREERTTNKRRNKPRKKRPN